MSISIMTKVWNSQLNLSSSELLILLALADWANDDGFCWPSVPTLARKARMNDRNTQLILRKLEKKRLIETLRNRGPKGVNKYRLLVQTLHQSVRHGVVQNMEYDGAKSVKQGEQNPAGGDANNDARQVHPNAPKPSLDPSEETLEKPPHTRLRATSATVKEGVGDGPKSNYSKSQVQQWADWKKSRGANIDPDAVALARYRDGLADDEIERFLALMRDGFSQPRAAPHTCPPECPLCFGSGMQVIPGKGARRCPNLTAQGQAAA